MRDFCTSPSTGRLAAEKQQGVSKFERDLRQAFHELTTQLSVEFADRNKITKLLVESEP